MHNNQTEQDHKINSLNVEVKTLTESINSLEADKQNLSTELQHKSMVLSSLDIATNPTKDNKANKKTSNTNITTTTNTLSTDLKTNIFTSPLTIILSPNTDQRQQLR